MTKIDNTFYGGFIVSNNILNGIPIRYSFREPSSIEQLNGWALYSEIDDNDYISDSNNFKIVNMETLYAKAPVFEELFSAPYGTDISWLYEENVHVGFYDLTTDKKVSISEIVESNNN